MHKSLILIACLVFILTSCSDESPADQIAGDYTGSITCTLANSQQELALNEVSVRAIDDYRISFDLTTDQTLSAEIDDDNFIIIDPTTFTFPDGTIVDLPQGQGNFALIPIEFSDTQLKTMSLLFSNVDQSEDTSCLITLTEFL